MNAIDKLAVITAIDKRLFAAKQAARDEVVDQLTRAFEDGGYTSANARLNGQQVAKVTLVNAEPKPTVTDRPAFEAWAKALDLGYEETHYNLEEIGRLMVQSDPALVEAEFPHCVRRGYTVPKDVLESALNVNGTAVINGTVVDGVEFIGRDRTVQVRGVDTDAVFTALSAGALSMADALALPEREE